MVLWFISTIGPYQGCLARGEDLPMFNGFLGFTMDNVAPLVMGVTIWGTWRGVFVSNADLNGVLNSGPEL